MQRLIDLHNNTPNLSAKMKSIEVDGQTEKQILLYVYPKTMEIRKHKFKVGDKLHLRSIRKFSTRAAI